MSRDSHQQASDQQITAWMKELKAAERKQVPPFADMWEEVEQVARKKKRQKDIRQRLSWAAGILLLSGIGVYGGGKVVEHVQQQETEKAIQAISSWTSPTESLLMGQDMPTLDFPLTPFSLSVWTSPTDQVQTMTTN